MQIALTIAFIIISVVLAILVLSQEGKDNGFTGIPRKLVFRELQQFLVHYSLL